MATTLTRKYPAPTRPNQQRRTPVQRTVEPVQQLEATQAAPVGTEANPSPNPMPQRTGLTPAPIVPRPAPLPPRPNLGGTMQRAGQPPVIVPPSPAGSAPTKATIPPGPSAPAPVAPAPLSTAPATPVAPVVSPTTIAAPQTESNNPLTGTGNAQPGGTTAPVTPPGQAMGFSARGAAVPAGQDAVTDPLVGGSGLYARKFSNPASAATYAQYVRTLFGAAKPTA